MPGDIFNLNIQVPPRHLLVHKTASWLLFVALRAQWMLWKINRLFFESIFRWYNIIDIEKILFNTYKYFLFEFHWYDYWCDLPHHQLFVFAKVNNVERSYGSSRWGIPYLFLLTVVNLILVLKQGQWSLIGHLARSFL